MLLPSTDSFVLVKQASITLPRFSILLPNAHSFLLVWPYAYATNLPPDTVHTEEGVPQSEQSADSEHLIVNDEKKRTFLKVAGVAGAGLVASQLLPKKTSALIMGSSPTTGVVGVKNVANTRINPATEETASSLLKTSDLTFDAGGALEIKVTSVSGEGSSSFSDSGGAPKSALVDGTTRNVQVDVLSSALPSQASTEDTLETISFGGVQFTLRLATVGDIDYVGEAVVGSGGEGDTVWRIKRIDSSSGVVIKWADGDAGLNNTWTGYAGHTYS